MSMGAQHDADGREVPPPASLAPSLLLSMPQLVDPNFNRTVVLLCKHSEEGAFGLVVNRRHLTTGRVVINLEPPASTERELEIWVGGPVEPQRSWVLVGHDPAMGEELQGMRIASGLYLSTAPDLLRRLVEAEPPARTRLMVGYSGWGAGQLEAELHASAWLMSEVDAELIFATPAEQMWETAIRRLGADPSSLQISRGVH
jgi:putative transcriptional regulator